MVVTFIYEKIICRFGLPRILQSDQETHFINEVIQKLTKRFRVRHILFSLYHLQLNELMKRFNKMLCKGIVKVAKEIEFWNKYIQPVLFTYQIKEFRISKQSPYKLVYERKLTLIMDYESYRGSIIERLQIKYLNLEK